MRQRRLKGLDEKLASYKNRKAIDRTLVKGRWQEMFSKKQPLYLELGCGKAQFILKMAQAHPEKNFVAIEGNRSVVLRALQKAERVRDDKGLLNPGERPEYVPNEKELLNPSEKPEYVPNEKELSNPSERPEHVQDEKELLNPSERAKHLADLSDKEKGNELQSSTPDTVWFITPNLVFVNLYMKTVGDCFAENELSGMYLNFSDPWPKDRHAARRLTHIGYLKGYGKALRPGSSLEFKTDNEGLFRFSVEQFEKCGLEQVDYSENLHNTDFESAKFMTEYEEKFSLRGHPIFYVKVKYPE